MTFVMIIVRNSIEEIELTRQISGCIMVAQMPSSESSPLRGKIYLFEQSKFSFFRMPLSKYGIVHQPVSEGFGNFLLIDFISMRNSLMCPDICMIYSSQSILNYMHPTSSSQCVVIGETKFYISDDHQHGTIYCRNM